VPVRRKLLPEDKLSSARGLLGPLPIVTPTVVSRAALETLGSSLPASKAFLVDVMTRPVIYLLIRL
jgi:hypothetical protein